MKGESRAVLMAWHWAEQTALRRVVCWDEHLVVHWAVSMENQTAA